VNARWERQPDADREAAELSPAAPAKLHAGDRASIRELIAGVHGATGAEGGPIVAQLVEATQQLAAAWSELSDKAHGQEQVLLETRDRAARVAGQLHGMVGAVHDALSCAPDGRRAAPRSRPKARPAQAVAQTLKVLTNRLLVPAANETTCARSAAPVLSVHVLGPFRASLNDRVIEDWPNCRGKAIFKYLLLHRRHPVARETLIERFWPEAAPDAARNNLNVAIHRLRRALGRDGFPFVLFSGGQYLLNPELVVAIDADAFLAHAARATALERDQDLDAAIRDRLTRDLTVPTGSLRISAISS